MIINERAYGLLKRKEGYNRLPNVNPPHSSLSLSDKVLIQCPLMKGSHQVFICKRLCKFYDKGLDYERCLYAVDR